WLLLAFSYKHLGQFAPLGGEQTAAQLPGVWVSIGHSSQWLWYSVYARDASITRCYFRPIGPEKLSLEEDFGTLYQNLGQVLIHYICCLCGFTIQGYGMTETCAIIV
ncbi:hypothetical protein LINPERPRIM_LOCUS7134, partial [Linum perenne]